jgi:hypothetical protein
MVGDLCLCNFNFTAMLTVSLHLLRISEMNYPAEDYKRKKTLS